ncbi:MAG: DUF1588 domain-containing protein [Rhodospirillaceae bacterium]
MILKVKSDFRIKLKSGIAGAAAALAVASCSGHAPERTAAAGAAAVSGPEMGGTAARVRLISEAQYFNTLSYVFGPEIKLAAHFAPMRRTDGLLQGGAASAGVTASQLEQYQRTASGIAAKIVDPEHRNLLVPCKPADEKAADRACAAKFLKAVGRLLYRRPLTEARLQAIVDKAAANADQLKDFYAGLGIALEGMLISPNFLMITDKPEPDPAHRGRQRLDAYALASRLSFFLWDAAPDDLVLKAAESGEIQTAKGRARIVEMMLASPRLTTGMRAFFDDMFAFDDFDNLAKDPKVYPSFTGVTVQDAREQTLRTVIDHLLTKKADYRDLFTTRDTFMSPALAAIYNLPAIPSWRPYQFPEGSPRAGLLTQISFLAGHAHPGRSSPTLRGKALRELLLCQTVPRPPANVDFSAVENPSSNIKTQRERVATHLKNPVCAGCHKITDPMGLALENFDGAGQYRTAEKGETIDPSGSLDGKPFTDVIGLGKALHDHPSLPQCLVKRVFSYGTGGPTSADDKPLLDYFDQRFAAQGYRLPDLLRTIVLSDAFAEVRAENPAPAKTAAAADAAAAQR